MIEAEMTGVPAESPAYPAVEEVPVPAPVAVGTPAVCVFAPVPLLTVTIEQLGDRGPEVHLHAGGQGVWIARMANILGARSVLCTILGGETGGVFESVLEEGIDLRKIDSGSATAAYVHDRRGGERREVVQTAPSAIGRHEQDELHNMALAESIEAGLCVLAGTQAFDALGPEVYRRFVADLRAVDVSVVADLAGPILDACLASGIDVLKISDEELLADGRISSAGEVDILEAIEALHAAGATDVVVSRRENGLLARYDGMLVHAIAPEMAVADARGAGDSLTAALAVARARRLSCPDALRVAAAAAAVNVTRHGLASGSREAIEQLAPRVEIRQIAR